MLQIAQVVGYLKCLLGFHAMQQHIVKAIYTDILTTWHMETKLKSIFFEKFIILIKKKHRNDYTLRN